MSSGGKVVAYFLAGFALGASLFGSGASTVRAHPASSWYTDFWDSSDLGIIQFFYDDDFFPGSGNWKNRVEDASDEWTFVQPSVFQYSRQGIVSQAWMVDCNAATDVVVFDRAMQGVYARTVSCHKTSGAFQEVQIAFDNEQNWYTGTGGPTASQVDARAIGTHEFGHATGWGPHLGTSLDCDQVAPIDFGSWQTMCNTIDALLNDPGGEAGRTFRRTLETHDQHTPLVVSTR